MHYKTRNSANFSRCLSFSTSRKRPAVKTQDELEFVFPKFLTVDESVAMATALEHYGFCPDVIDQGPEDATVGRLADGCES